MEIERKDDKIHLEVSFKEYEAIEAAIYLLYCQDQVTDIAKEYQSRFQETCYNLYLNTTCARWFSDKLKANK